MGVKFPKKGEWTKKDIANYYSESRTLSDYSVKKGGIIESKYKKSSIKKRKK